MDLINLSELEDSYLIAWKCRTKNLRLIEKRLGIISDGRVIQPFLAISGFSMTFY